MFCAVVAALTAHSAAAEDIIGVKSVDLQVQGRIPEHCVLGSPGRIDFGDITRPNLSAEARVAFDCNMPFTVNVRAERGALAHSSLPLGQGPYAGSLDYKLDLEIPVRKPTTEIITQAYASRSLRSGQTFSSNGGIATDGLSLRMTLSSPSRDAGLLAGNYGEVIVITVTPT